jgi:predicted phage terminase large subunit-like protein
MTENLAGIVYQPPSITHARELEEKSRWRMYKRGIRELELLEAPKSVIQEFRYKAARNCFLAFCDLMKNGDLKVAAFHEIIGSAFEDLFDRRYRRLIISCPPRSGKSMLSTMFLAWLLGKDERTQHILASYGSTLSQKFHREAVVMMKSATYRKIFPEFSGFNRDSKYDLAAGGYILATSVGGILTGFTSGTIDMESKGIGVALIDDPLKSSDSKAALETLESWWAEQMSTRRTNHYAQVIVATRFHEKDLHGVLLDGDGIYDYQDNPFGWRWVNIQGLCEDEESDILGRKLGESHWPENTAFAVPVLESQRKIMGSFKFAALYQGVPVAAEGQIVKNSWISTIDEEDCPPLDVIWFGVDCAFSEKEMADESAICVAGINTRNPETVYIRDIVKGRWGFPDLLEAIKQQCAYYRARVLCIEKAASGQSLIQVLKRESKIPIEEMKPIRSKTVRLQAVSPLMESERVKLVRGPWTDSFVKELTAFPFVRHDDSVDALVWALTYYSLKLDSIDRGIQQAIIQSKKWRGDYRRPEISYTSESNPSNWKSPKRQLGRDSSFNDPDFGSPDLSNGDAFSGRRGSRRPGGYESLF